VHAGTFNPVQYGQNRLADPLLQYDSGSRGRRRTPVGRPMGARSAPRDRALGLPVDVEAALHDLDLDRVPLDLLWK
jgi:hypothetical protein